MKTKNQNRDEAKKVPALNNDVFATVWRHWKPAFKKNAVPLLLTLVLYNLSAYFDQMLKPIYWKKAFDQINTHADPMQSFYNVVMCFGLAWACSRIGDYTVVLSESNIIKRLRDNALYGLMRKDAKFFANHFMGGLVSKARRFSAQSEAVIDQILFNLSRTAVLVIYILVYMFIAMPDVGFLFLIWVIVFVSTTLVFAKLRLKADLASSAQESKTTGVFSDIIGSILYLRSFSREHDEFEKFKESSYDDQSCRRRAWFLSNYQWAMQGLLVFTLEAVVMYIVMQKVMTGVETIGTLAMVQIYIISLANNMYQLGQALIRLRTGLTDAYEMAVILDDEINCTEEILKPEQSGELKLKEGIIFEKVNFSYDNGERKILQDFSFKFVVGCHYGIVGTSGAGKSTLFKILLRQNEHLHEHEAGKVLIDGLNIRKIKKVNLRKLIAYVPQSPAFPSRTIIEILKLGKHDATECEIRVACEKAGCQFIWEKFEKGFDTKVGERGVKLSGGEAQRIAIATAILKDAPIVIMDEPTSALDAETESIIQQSITKHFVGKTMLVIAHRLATVAVLDEILLVENGTVAHNAPHDEMLKISEMYANMWRLQTRPGEGLNPGPSGS